ncbi:MAG: hypothetical protein ACQEP7_02900 [bacterium]
MNNRQKVMVLALVVFMGIGGYYHREKVLPYLQPVLQMAGLNVSAESTPEITPSYLVQRGEKNLQKALRNSFDLPETTGKKNIVGFTGEGRLNVNFPEGMQVFENSNNLETEMKLDVYDTESFQIDFALLSPTGVNLPEVTFKKSGDQQVLLYPADNEYYPVEETVEEYTPETASKNWQLNPDALEETTRGSRKVYRVEYEMDDQPALEIFITRKEPHMFVEGRGLTEDSEGQFKLEYEKANDISRIKNASFREPAEKNENGDGKNQFKLDRGDFNFIYSNGSIDKLVLKQPVEDSGQNRQVTFNFSQQEGISSGAQISVEDPAADISLDVGEISWQFKNGWPQEVDLDFQIPLGPKPVNMQFVLENMKWHEEKREFDSTAPEDFKRIEFKQLAQKYQPFMEKTGFFQGGQMSPEGSEKQLTVDTDSEVKQAGKDTGSSSSPPQSEPEPEDTSATSQPESTPEQRSAEETERAEPPAPEADTKSVASEEEEEEETERVEQPEPEPDTEPVSSAEAEEKEQDSPAGETESEAEDKSAQSKEGPEQSGEGIHYSSIDRFPMSDPPQEFEVAREYFSKGDFRQAEEKLNKLVEKYPNSANVNYMLGVINFESSRFEKAITYFEKGSKLAHDPQLQVWSRKYLDRIDNKLENEEETEEK